MASIGTHKVPKETTSITTNWGKRFKISTGQLVAGIVVVLIDFGIYKLFDMAHLPWEISIFIDLCISAVAGTIIFGVMPPSKYLLASGLPFWRILIRMIIHKKNHKYLYIRGYGEENEEGKSLWNSLAKFLNI